MGRSGKGGAGSSKKFAFEDWGGEKKAHKAAKAWLAKQKAEYTPWIKKNRKLSQSLELVFIAPVKNVFGFHIFQTL